MKRTGAIIILLLTVAIFYNASAQTHTIDSLRQNANRAKSITGKTAALIELCNQKYSLPADSLFKYASLINELNKEDPNGSASITAEYFIAYSRLIRGEEDAALAVANRYLQQLKDRPGDKELYKLFLHLRGIIYYRTNRSKETINNYYELLNIAQQQNDTLYMLIAKRGISLAYIANGQDPEGLKLFHNARTLLPAVVPARYDEVYGLLLVSAAISNLHLHQNTHLMSYADSCAFYGQQAIDLGRRTDNLFIQCQGLIVTGVIQSYKNNIVKAEELLKEGLEIRKLIADTIYILSDMSVLGSFYANTKQVEKGVAICKAGIELAQRRKLSPALLLLLYNALAENYKAGGYFKEYGETLKKQMAVKDSLNIKSSTDELKDLETKYDLQKQENTIIQQKLDITKKNYWLYGSVLFSVMALAIFWLAFRNYQRRQNLKMKLALEEEKRIAVQSVIDAEEQERKRIAADLHDNLGVYAASLSSNINYLRPADADTMGNTALIELRNNSNSIISELNDTIWVLKKDALSLTAISDRVKVFINRIGKSYPEINIEVKENIETDFKLPSSQAFHLYRVIQEAVNNALKHSKGKNVVIEFISTNEWQVKIQDDGIGINQPTNTQGGGNGLQHMKDRVQEAGWTITWENEKEGRTGFVVTINPTTN